ncbi:hypothetical protein E1218_08865 [Kribbella turkmenica]|uniref:Uncharacterized protein n=1 Tax=Kribbella turkmenica TaxID=2530375 RepID=A0A4R4XBF1_9ACTN|nr:hypothetical protein [Kribbella turkmenica]TDD27893.1 hypothetical protein E1218_08865 [Kribbella turkmenica]
MYIEVRAGDREWLAQVDAEIPAEWLHENLPLRLHAVQSEWSGQVMELFGKRVANPGKGVAPQPFQHAGQIVFSPALQRFAIAFGDGRWQDGFSVHPAIPVARIDADLEDFEAFGKSLMFVGARPVDFSLVADSALTHQKLEARIREQGRLVQLRIGTASAHAVLLEKSAPNLTASLARRLPLQGRAANTYSSGPLTRFWDSQGNEQGSTDLELDVDESTVASSGRVLAAPGFIYYMPNKPYNGLRIAARSTTMMRSALPGARGRTPLLPVAQFVGDWRAIADAAENIRFTGALPLTLAHAPADVSAQT